MAKNLLSIAGNSLFASKSRLLVTTLVLASFTVTTLALKSGIEKANRLSVLQAGIQTCHKRIHQTLTARLIGDTKNIALESGFLNATEECFAEAIKQMETFGDNELVKARAKLHNISSDVHWFNVNVAPGSSVDNLKNPETVIQNGLNSRYRKIEAAKDDVIFHLDRVEENNSSGVLYGKIAFFALLAFSIFSVGADVVIRRRDIRRREEVEGRAVRELGPGNISSRENIEVILKDALEVNSMVNCSALFTRYRTSISLGEALNNEKVVAPIVKMVAPEKVDQELIEQIWQESEKNEEAVFSYEEEISTPLSAILAKTVQSFSSSLFSKGIALNLNVFEDINVLAEEESVEQVLFHSVSYVLNNVKEDRKAKLGISLNERGNTTVLEYTYNGNPFSVTDLKANALSGSDRNFESLELTIIDELIKSWNGELILINKEEELVAMKIIFRNSTKAKASEKTKIAPTQQGLVSLTKGKKKDLKLPLSAPSQMN